MMRSFLFSFFLLFVISNKVTSQQYYNNNIFGFATSNTFTFFDVNEKKFIEKVNKQNIISKPLPIKNHNDHINWQMKQGEINKIEVKQWCWNFFGVGTILVLTFLGLTLILQRIRLQMGFGFPELPP